MHSITRQQEEWCNTNAKFKAFRTKAAQQKARQHINQEQASTGNKWDCGHDIPSEKLEVLPEQLRP